MKSEYAFLFTNEEMYSEKKFEYVFMAIQIQVEELGTLQVSKAWVPLDTLCPCDDVGLQPLVSTLPQFLSFG